MIGGISNMKSPLEKIIKGTVNRSKLLLQKSDPKKISHINFAVTYVCNSRCKHCNIWNKYKEKPKEAKKELKLEEIEEIFEKSQYLKNLQAIDLTGGEPFIRKDFIDLCGFFIEKYPNAGITIPTNAVNLDLITNKLEEIVKMYNPKNIYIAISLDGIGETHDKIRGIPGDYNHVLELIEIIKKRLPTIKQAVSCTITPENYGDLLKVYKLSKKESIGFGLQFAQISGSFYGNIETEFEWNETKLDEVNKMINLIIKEYSMKQGILQKMMSCLFDVNTCYLSHMVDFQRNPHMISRCYSGTHSFFMDPYGNIYPCIMLNKKIGNIRELDFDELWLSTEAQEIREFIKDKKCACWTSCETGPSLIRSPEVVLWNLKNLIKEGR